MVQYAPCGKKELGSTEKGCSAQARMCEEASQANTRRMPSSLPEEAAELEDNTISARRNSMCKGVEAWNHMLGRWQVGKNSQRGGMNSVKKKRTLSHEACWSAGICGFIRIIFQQSRAFYHPVP